MAAVLVPVEGKITGHTPRRTGAQLLAMWGVAEPTICWFGRWGSAAVKAYLEDARTRSRAGRRIWSEAMAADALPVPAASDILSRPGSAPEGQAASGFLSRPGSAPEGPMGSTLRRLEADRACEPAQRPRVAAVKMYVLNKETRRLHVFAAGASKSLCRYFSLSTASAMPSPVLEGKAYRGKEVDPCVRCRRAAISQGLLNGGRAADDAGGSSSSDASDSGEAE